MQLVRQYSIQVERDLEQLLRMMLFNRAINNTDTHERNFSFMYNGTGYQLSPAYDMVPSLTVGQYPIAGFDYSPQPPLCSEVVGMGKVFGLPKTRVKLIAEEVSEAVSNWPCFARKNEVSAEDTNAVANVIRV